jgi:hypothetical protein
MIIGSHQYLHLFKIHLYTKYHLNPSNHHWENSWTETVIIKSVTDGRTDGRRTGWTSPYQYVPFYTPREDPG